MLVYPTKLKPQVVPSGKDRLGYIPVRYMNHATAGSTTTWYRGRGGLLNYLTLQGWSLLLRVMTQDLQRYCRWSDFGNNTASVSTAPNDLVCESLKTTLNVKVVLKTTWCTNVLLKTTDDPHTPGRPGQCSLTLCFCLVSVWFSSGVAAVLHQITSSNHLQAVSSWIHKSYDARRVAAKL